MQRRSTPKQKGRQWQPPLSVQQENTLPFILPQEEVFNHMHDKRLKVCFVGTVKQFRMYLKFQRRAIIIGAYDK